MSKRTKRCPECGGQMPANAKICRRCQAKRDAQRAQRVDTLPKPIRPEETSVEKTPKPVEIPTAVDMPKPVETARRPEPTYRTESARRSESTRSSQGSSRNRRKKSNVGQFVAVLAVIAVVIAVAVVLVIKMNQNTTTETSEEYNGVHIVNQNGEDITPTEPPQSLEEEEQAAQDEQEAVIASEVEPDSEETEAEEQNETETAAESDETETAETVYVNGSGVNLRSGPSTTYEVIATLNRGVELTRTGTTEGWSQVEYEGQVCYVSTTLLSDEDPLADDSTAAADTTTAAAETETIAATTTTAATETVTVTSKANIRKGPGTEYDVVAILPVGTELIRTDTTGNWSQVTYNGQVLYIHNNMVSVTSDDAVTATVGESSGTVTIKSKANIRSGPGTGYAILGVEDVGQSFKVTGLTDTNWYQISYNGQTAYVAGNMVTKNG